MWSSRPYTFDRVVRIFFSAIVVGIILYFLYILRDVMLPFFAACLIAYIIEPLVELNRRSLKIKSHKWAVLLTVFEGLCIVVAVSVILIPIIDKEFSQLSVLLDRYMRDDHPFFLQLPEDLRNFIHSKIDIDRIISEIEKINISQMADSIWKDITAGLSKILGILGWLICVVYIIFILLDFDKFKNGIKKYIPEKYKASVNQLSSDVSWSMKRYFRNQALISFIVGICYIIGFSIVGIPMAVIIGLMNMVLFMVPYLVYVSVIPVIIMCLFKSMETGMDFWTILLECAAVYVFVEMFSDLILTPRIMGKAFGLNAGIILLSLSVWGSLLGLLGMLIALPATTILLKWIKFGLGNWKNKVDSEGNSS